MRSTLLLPVARRVIRETIFPTCWLFFFLLAATALQAQEPHPLDRRIDISIKDGTLHEAIETIRLLSGARISYSIEELGKQPRVTLQTNNETARKVLEKILSQSTLRFIETDYGVVTIVPRSVKKEQETTAVWFLAIGQVFDKKENPLVNASVQVVGEKMGATTDNKGIFTVLVKQNSRLRFSFLGMKTQEYIVRSKEFVRIALDTAPVVLNEYVITGYQMIDKRMLASSVYTLTPDKFMEQGAPSVDQMLQGKVPGLTVINNSGSPAATPKIRIRGTSTILGNASPLWVVDGIIKEDPVDLNPLQINAALQDAQNANFSIVGNAIAGLNPYDIESLTFLKDASATAIYGVRAANGVIVVKTKRGKAGPTVINYDISMGFTGVPSYRSVNAMNSKERIDVSREAAEKGTYYSGQPVPASYEGLLQQLYHRDITQEQFNQQVGQLETMNTDWLHLLARNAFNQTHSLSFSGGSGKTTYYGSLSYSDASGSFRGDNTKRYTATANLESSVNSRLSVGLKFEGSLRTADGYYQVNPSDYALKTSRAISADSPYVAAWTDGGNGAGVLPLHYSIFNEMAQTGNKSSTQELSAIGTIRYRLLPGLSFSGTYGAELSSVRLFSYAAERSYYISHYRGYDFNAVTNGSLAQQMSPIPFGGLAYPNNMSNVNYTIRNQLDYNRHLFGGRDQFSITVVQEAHSAKSDGVSSQELGYYPDRGNTYYSDYYNARPGILYGSASQFHHYATTTNAIANTMSWIGSASYQFRKRYTINANIRTDGSNRFGQYANQKFLPNWSVAGRWDLGEEPWVSKSDVLSGCSLRGSYGTAGNVVSQVSPNLIASYPTSPVDVASNEYVLNLKTLPYPSLRWEKTTSYNFGVDLNLFNGHVVLTADGYYKDSRNLLVSKNIPEEYGVTVMYMNYGRLSNAGWDGNLTLIPVRTRDFEWSQSFIVSKNYNKVIQSSLKQVYTDYLNGAVIQSGKPLDAFYSFTFTGLDHQYGIPQYGNVGKNVAAMDPSQFLTYSGRLDPTVNVGTTTYIRYKRFTLNAQFNINLGNHRRLNAIYGSMAATAAGLPSSDQNLPKELVGRWRQPGDEAHTNIPSFTNWRQESGYVQLNYLTGSYTLLSPYSMYDQSTARVINGDFLRCRAISLNYNLPASVLKGAGIKAANIEATVNNPFILESSQLHGQDPEIKNAGGTALPITASYYLKVGISF